MTAGEADVNSSIRFQSACTVSTLLRNEELLKIRPPHEKIPQKYQKSYYSLHNLKQKMLLLHSAAGFDVAIITSVQQKPEDDFLGWSLLVRLFLMPSLLVRAGGSFAALQAQASSLDLAFHTRSTVKACDRPQTPQPTAPLYPLLCCLANYEYSTAMKVILSDMQLSSHIVSAVPFVECEGRLSQGRHHSSPLLSDLMTKTDCKMT